MPDRAPRARTTTHRASELGETPCERGSRLSGRWPRRWRARTARPQARPGCQASPGAGPPAVRSRAASAPNIFDGQADARRCPSRSRRQQRAARAQPAGQQRAVLARRARVGQRAGHGQQPADRRAPSGKLIQPITQLPGRATDDRRRSLAADPQRWIIPYGGALVLIVVCSRWRSSTWRKGPIGGHEPDTGRVIERFTYFERAAHWSNAIAFCVLPISGLVMAFGKFFLLPLIGGTLFGWLT